MVGSAALWTAHALPGVCREGYHHAEIQASTARSFSRVDNLKLQTESDPQTGYTSLNYYIYQQQEKAILLYLLHVHGGKNGNEVTLINQRKAVPLT